MTADFSVADAVYVFNGKHIRDDLRHKVAQDERRNQRIRNAEFVLEQHEKQGRDCLQCPA